MSVDHYYYRKFNTVIQMKRIIAQYRSLARTHGSLARGAINHGCQVTAVYEAMRAWHYALQVQYMKEKYEKRERRK